MIVSESISLTFISDIHLGIRSIDQKEMADALADNLFPALPTTDILCINGDFFDTLVVFDSHGFDPIYEVILMLFRICQEYRIKLRILQGTFSHDRKQLDRFDTFYRNNHFDFDFRCVRTLDLEEIIVKDRALRFLFVPDDLPYKSSDDVVEVIKTKLIERGWHDVDYACMHGFFDFTYPKAISQENTIVFKESQFPFVKKAIDVGHVHQYRVGPNGKAISNGSFDRLTHGDEAPKGFIRVIDYPDSFKAQFVENKDSAIYNTLCFTDEDTDVIREAINEHIESLKTDRTISLRISITSPEIGKAIKSWMNETHPRIKCSIKREIVDKGQVFTLTTSPIVVSHEKRIAPTPKTLSTFIRNALPSHYELSIERIEDLLGTSDS
jgi:UDP-2,3-diacylglucosamine pyrophosphatase LpxH